MDMLCQNMKWLLVYKLDTVESFKYGNYLWGTTF